jgi:hypothetical protein
MAPSAAEDLFEGAAAGAAVLAAELVSFKGKLMSEAAARRASSAKESAEEEAARAASETARLVELGGMVPEERDNMAKVRVR